MQLFEIKREKIGQIVYTIYDIRYLTKSKIVRIEEDVSRKILVEGSTLLSETQRPVLVLSDFTLYKVGVYDFFFLHHYICSCIPRGVISRLSVRVSIGHEHFLRDLSIIQIYDPFSSSAPLPFLHRSQGLPFAAIPAAVFCEYIHDTHKWTGGTSFRVCLPDRRKKHG